MKAEQIVDALNSLDDTLLQEADQARTTRSQKPKMRPKWGLAAACLLLAVALPAAAMLFKQGQQTEKTNGPDTNDSLSQDIAEEEQNEAGQKDDPEQDVDPERKAAILAQTVGPLQLGMTQQEVSALLGEPQSVSNAGVVEMEDGSLRINWFYLLSGNPDYRYDLSLGFVDEGEGWRLNEITAFEDCGLALSSGIEPGSSEAEVAEAYPDFEKATNGQSTTYHLSTGYLALSLYLQEGKVQQIYLGSYYAPPEIDWDAPSEDPAAAFQSESLTVYWLSDGSWQSAEPDDQQLKHLQVVMGIEALEPLEELAAPAAVYLDFHNDTVVALFAEDESGAIYHLTDRDGFETALQNGASPEEFLEQTGCYRFPAGTWEAAWDCSK